MQEHEAKSFNINQIPQGVTIEKEEKPRELAKMKPNYLTYEYWKEFLDRLMIEVQPDIKLTLIFTNNATKEHTFFNSFEDKICEKNKEIISEYFQKSFNKEYTFNYSVMAIIFDPTKVPIYEKLKSDYTEARDLRNK